MELIEACNAVVQSATECLSVVFDEKIVIGINVVLVAGVFLFLGYKALG